MCLGIYIVHICKKTLSALSAICVPALATFSGAGVPAPWLPLTELLRLDSDEARFGGESLGVLDPVGTLAPTIASPDNLWRRTNGNKHEQARKPEAFLPKR